MARIKGRAGSPAPTSSDGRALRKRPARTSTVQDSDPPNPPKSRRLSALSRANQDADPVDWNDSRAKETPQSHDAIPQSTPKKRGRPPKPRPTTAAAEGDSPVAPRSGHNGSSQTPVKTPVRLNGVNGADTPSRRNIADRSARRKSARALIGRVLGDATSDDEGGDEAIARAIYESGGSEDDEDREEDARDSDEDLEPLPSAATTPSKTPGRRGRKPGAARKKSPTPPRDLPPHEQFFFQNKPGLAKTSNNTLSSLDLLTHDEYFTLVRGLSDPHAEDIQYLETLHAESFPQWAFELSQGFSICLYGYGSKKQLTHQLTCYLYSTTGDHDRNKIVVVNGYLGSATAKEVLTTVAAAADPSVKLGLANPIAMLQDLLALLTASKTTVVLVINSIDAPPLRRSGTQSILARLAAHPHIQLLCSADTPDVGLLWDSGLRSSFNMLFHDCTTFAPYAAEVDVVDEVHELLGRKARRAGGKDGVAFVLRSLPENARSLFQLLIGEVLASAGDDSGGAGENPGIEYRMLYNKAVEEFICSSEMAFRTLLKEFHDHQVITSRKDILGTELLSLPFDREELEAILEDLMG